MSDIDRWPHRKSDALVVHGHTCPLCNRYYSCNCSEYDRKAKLVCIDCERKGK